MSEVIALGEYKMKERLEHLERSLKFIAENKDVDWYPRALASCALEGVDITETTS